MLARRFGQVFEGDLVFLQPELVGVAAIEPRFQFPIGDDAALHRIHQQHLARLQPALEFDVPGFDGEHASLRGHDDQVVVRHQVAGRAQAVAVQGGADGAAVGKRHGGRAVPGLHQRSVVLVKGPLLRVHVRVLGPGFRNQHGHGVGDAAAGHDQQLERVVEGRGVAAARLNDGKQLLNIVAEQWGGQHRLARVHPVHVAAQGVDFPVVRHVAEGVRQRPGGEGVGGEALVHQAQGADHVRVAQLGVEVGDLGRQ